MKEIEIPDGVPEETYLRVLRAFFGADPDSGHPSNILLESLLEAPVFFRHAVAVAFQAGRESAYTTDEWRVAWINRGNGDTWYGARYYSPDFDEELARSAISAWRREHNPKAWMEHRRSGATDWEKVSDA